MKDWKENPRQIREAANRLLELPPLRLLEEVRQPDFPLFLRRLPEELRREVLGRIFVSLPVRRTAEPAEEPAGIPSV
jgi:hypothetical protein